MMKKIPVVLLFLAMVCLASKCENTPNTSKPQPPAETTASQTQPDTIYKSLNGLNYTNVKTYRDEFSKNALNRIVPQKQVSIWFSREVFLAMIDLVKREKGDGIRLYFINEGRATKKDFEIAVVATTLFEGAPNEYSKHRDYYAHKSNEALFKMDGIKGEKGIGNCGGGALLYKSCDTCNTNPCGSGSADGRLLRRDAEAMIGNFGRAIFGTVNTKSVWFDLKKLEGISQLTFDGIRIYYGRYTNNTSGNIEASAKQRDTFILMPTVTKKENQTTIQKDKFECALIEKLLFNIYEKIDDPYNNGELCPTHCNLDTTISESKKK